MLKFVLGLFDGPIVSHIAGAVVGFVVTFFANQQHPLDQQTQAALLVAVTGIVGKGIQIFSAKSGNAVTSTTAANAHPAAPPTSQSGGQ